MKHDDRLAEAARRASLNRHSSTNQSIEGDADYLGVAGEDAWIRWCHGRGVDPGPRPEKRTPGYQFTTKGVKVKVQCSRTPGHLLVKTTRVAADVYVLAAFDDASRQATLLGWTFASTVREAPTKSYSKGTYSVISHAVRVRDLHPMATLGEFVSKVDEATTAFRDFEEQMRRVNEVASVRPTPKDVDPVQQLGFDLGPAARRD